MTGPLQTIRKIWAAAIARHEPEKPQVIIHDPAAHNLDDPFFDETVQMRVAEKIAAAGNRKTKNSF